MTVMLPGAAGRKLDTVSAEVAVEDVRSPRTVTIRESLWKRARIVAIERGVTASVLVEQALDQMLDKVEEEK